MTSKLIGDPEAVRLLLLPYLRKKYPTIQNISRPDVQTMGSVQAGRGIAHITVRATTTTGQIKRFDLFANYDTRGGSKTIYHFLTFLANHGFGAGAYGAPQPLGYSAKYKLLVYESFSGRRVRDDLEERKLTTAGLMSVMRQSARWLKKFHRLPPRIGHQKNLRLAPNFFAKLTPAHRRVIAAALPFINAELKKVGRRSLVHGDPHLANCIRGPKRSFAFIDFSESHVGSAAADIAMYLVHLDVALQPFFSRQVIARAQREFITAYYGRSVETLTLADRRALLAYELRTAALFLRFTSDHHRHPSSQVAWMIQHFVNIVSRGTNELRGKNPRVILAS